MPYLRITCPDVSPQRRREIALRLTDAINDLFFTPHAPTSRDELRERTTVHFLSYHADDLFIGGHTPQERGATDLTIELSDWNMSERQQRKVAAALTPLLAELFSIRSSQLDGINIRFHPYPPRDFAVGGRLLADIVPRIGQWMKHVVG